MFGQLLPQCRVLQQRQTLHVHAGSGAPGETTLLELLSSTGLQVSVLRREAWARDILRPPGAVS